MKNLLFGRGSLLRSLCLLFLAVAPAKAAITVYSFGPDGTGNAQIISPLNTVIEGVADLAPDYRVLNSSNADLKFVRHIYTEELCFYWFRADGDPNQYSETEEYSNVYWYVGNVGSPSCIFVDGAQDGSDNFVLLHSTALDRIVGVLQYRLNDLNDINSPALLLAYAVNPEGMTFAEGVAAIQAIPEPSTMALSTLVLMGGLLARRHHRRRALM